MSKLENKEDDFNLFSEEGNQNEQQPYNPFSSKETNNFYEDLSKYIDESSLDKIADYIINLQKEDEKARQPWLANFDKLKKALGFDLEDSQKRFKSALGTFDTALANNIMKMYCIISSDILHPKTPTDAYLYGASSPDLQINLEKQVAFMNLYLTVMDEDYYKDFSTAILYFLVSGCVFKKAYINPKTGLPIVRFIKPNNLLIDSDCIAASDANRYIHIMELSKRDIILKMKNGDFREVKLSYLKTKQNESSSTEPVSEEEFNKENSPQIDLEAYNIGHSLYPISEAHVYINLNEFISNNHKLDNDELQLPLPYIISVDLTDKKVLGIFRNWKQEDKLKSAIKYFVCYAGFPYWGPYTIGLAHILGSNSIAATSVLRLLVDSGTLSSFPSAFKVGPLKGSQTNQYTMEPGTLQQINPQEIEAGQSIKDAIMPIPYPPPSQQLMDLYRTLNEQINEAGINSELGMMQSREDIPTATALAFLERINIQQSSILKSVHRAFTEELRLLQSLFKETVGYEEFFYEGRPYAITGQEFIEDVKIIPISDPSINSRIQKAMEADYVLNNALKVPEIHNIPQVFEYVYKQQGLDEDVIKTILKQPEQMQQEAEAAAQQQQGVSQEELIMADLANEQQKNALKAQELQNQADAKNMETTKDMYKTQLEYISKHKKMELEKEMAELKAHVELLKAQIKDNGLIPLEFDPNAEINMPEPVDLGI